MGAGTLLASSVPIRYHRRILGTSRHLTVPSSEDVENRPSLNGPGLRMVTI